MLNWLHHLLNPHCQECKDESTESKVCQSCETLKMQLSIANAEKQRMLDSLLEKPKVDIEPKMIVPENAKPKMVTWQVRRQMLEAEDRKTAEINRKLVEEALKLKAAKTTEELEKEMGVENVEAS